MCICERHFIRHAFYLTPYIQAPNTRRRTVCDTLKKVANRLLEVFSSQLSHNEVASDFRQYSIATKEGFPTRWKKADRVASENG